MHSKIWKVFKEGWLNPSEKNRLPFKYLSNYCFVIKIFSHVSDCVNTLDYKYRQLCLIRTCVIRILVLTGQIGRSQSLRIIPIRIIRILPNPDRNLGSTSFRIKQSGLYCRNIHCAYTVKIISKRLPYFGATELHPIWVNVNPGICEPGKRFLLQWQCR